MTNSQKIETIREILHSDDLCNAEKFERIEEIVLEQGKVN
jgi:hypothetical protein